MKGWLLTLGLIYLIALEILRVYFIMPFPGSQHANTIGLAWFIDRNRIVLRIIGLLLVLVPLYGYLVRGKTWSRVLLTAVILFYGVVFYYFNYRFEADKMFYQPTTVSLTGVANNKVPGERLVIGLVVDGEARAYPIQLIGYHHQVRDTIGHTPVMITYCTVCRTGRVYSPLVDGRPETFRLVGMDHFNAMFEDATTGSWWQQATGVAIAGPLKGSHLTELPSRQSSLDQWIAEYPDSRIFQADTVFNKRYDDLTGYDRGTIKGGLERRDSSSWGAKSWVVGVTAGNATKAYDWNLLVQRQVIQDSVSGYPILLAVSGDSVNFRAWDRRVEGQSLAFIPVKVQAGPLLLKDVTSGSTWDFTGKCVDGPMKGRRLQPLQAYQEFWHSWSWFHPGTEKYSYFDHHENQ